MPLKKLLFSFICLWLGAQTAHGLADRHLIIIQAGEIEPAAGASQIFTEDPQANLSTTGREQVKQMAERLLTHGFDNRSIAAVYASTAKSTLQTCELLSDIGVFSTQKIRMDLRLSAIEEDNLDIFTLYDEVETNHPKGHIVFVTHAVPSQKLIESLTQTSVSLHHAQAYLVPLAKRNVLPLLTGSP